MVAVLVTGSSLGYAVSGRYALIDTATVGGGGG